MGTIKIFIILLIHLVVITNSKVLTRYLINLNSNNWKEPIEQEYNQCQGKLTDLEWKLEKMQEEVKMWKSNFYENGIKKLPHPEFKSEWYTTVMKWVTENYSENTVEHNRELDKITNNLEQIFVTKLRTLFPNNDLTITPEYFAKLHKEGAIDDNLMSQVHSFGLKLQQMYVEKVIQLYDLQPSFFKISEAEFCEIFGVCQ